MKINNQWNKSIQQENDIKDQTDINEKNINNENVSNIINQYIKKLSDLNTDDFVALNRAKGESFATGRVFDENLSFEWVVDIGFLPELFLPYLNIQIIYKSPKNLMQLDFDNGIFDDTPIRFTRNHTISVNEDGQFTLRVHIIVQQTFKPQFPSPFLIEDIEAKLIVSLKNPNDYI